MTLTDNLPDGVDWADNSAACTIAPDVGTTGQVLSCAFGDLADDASVSVTVTGATDAADCGTLTNTATADAGNEASERG